ncbi:MAG TPA: CHAP domain-containing protein [Candidatus Saccharimonadales bacterium]|nr:CHAP domain-containing protein [Candidatus Saccharimonadales bacterium]
MQRVNTENIHKQIWQRLWLLALVAAMLLGGVLTTGRAQADRYDDQIRSLEQQISQTQHSKDHLNLEAENLNDVIAGLQAKISALESEVTANQAKSQGIQNEIAAAEVQLDNYRDILGDVLRESYLASDISTLEMLASSKSLSDFIDQQEYRSAIQTKIKKTLDKVMALQQELKTRKASLDKLLADQKAMQGQLDAQRSESGRLLALNQSQQAAYTSEIKQNNAAITKLRALQAAENARLYASGTAPRGIQGGGGYPAKWANAPMDSLVDTWGMYNRECVSFTAWKVASAGRHMPYWGGRGNAKQWPDNARAAGIPVDGNPRPGDVAISTRGIYGHSMYVEAVNDDGTITVSQYNAAWDGNFSTARVYTDGLQFIHF